MMSDRIYLESNIPVGLGDTETLQRAGELPEWSGDIQLLFE